MQENDKLTERPSYYAIIPANVRYDKSLSPNAKLLYSEITALLNFKNRCFASNAYFGRLYCISDVQVSRLIKQLIDAGHVFSEMEITSKGTQRLIKLALNINDNTPIIKKVNTRLNKNVKYNNQSNNNSSLIDIKESCCFDDFWKLYGKNVGKKPCEKIWTKIKLDVRKVIFERLPKWKLQFTNSQFYPNPETFLQDERWNDEILGEPAKPIDQENILSQITDIPSDILFNKLSSENKSIIKRKWIDLGHKFVNTGSISYCGWYLNNGIKVTPR